MNPPNTQPKENLMKKAILLTALIALIAMPVFANDIFENTDLGAKVDLPNIVLKKGNHAIGVEISITDITKDWDLGSQAMIKYTNTLCAGICDK